MPIASPTSKVSSLKSAAVPPSFSAPPMPTNTSIGLAAVPSVSTTALASVRLVPPAPSFKLVWPSSSENAPLATNIPNASIEALPSILRENPDVNNELKPGSREPVALAQSTRSVVSVPSAIVARLIKTLPLAVKIKPSTPTRLAPARETSKPT